MSVLRNPALPAFALLVCAATAAQAEPGGVSGVSGPSVIEGETRLEVRTASFEGGALDGSWNHRAIVSHGASDWWRPALNLRASQPEGEDVELTSIALENVFDFTASREWPVHFGLLAEYKFGLGNAGDAIDLKLLAEAKAGAFTARLNLIAAGQIDNGADWVPAYAGRGMWRVSENTSLGLEIYGEPEVSAHYVGPRATMGVGRATFAFGYLAGFEDVRARGQFRFGVEFAS